MNEIKGNKVKITSVKFPYFAGETVLRNSLRLKWLHATLYWIEAAEVFCPRYRTYGAYNNTCWNWMLLERYWCSVVPEISNI